MKLPVSRGLASGDEQLTRQGLRAELSAKEDLR